MKKPAHPNTSLHRVLLCLLLLSLLLSACGSGNHDQTDQIEEGIEDQLLSSVISATGQVIPRKWANLSLSAGGIVSEVLVTEGDQVSEGQPLVYLHGGEPSNPSPQLQAAITAAELELQSARQARDTLYENADRIRAKALQTIGVTAGQIRELQYQIEDLELPDEQEDLTPTEAYELARKDYEQARDAYEPYRDEPRSDSTRQDLLEDLEQAKEDYDVAVIRLDLSTALEAAQTNYDLALQDYESYADGPPQSEIDLAQKRTEAAVSALQVSKEAVKNMALLAPFSGTVSEILVRGGEWVSPGMPLLVLADLSQLHVETTDLNEIDMSRIKVGDPAEVSFDAITDLIVSGEVVYIADKSSTGVGVDYRTVIILDSLPEKLKWGMTAFVDIIPGE